MSQTRSDHNATALYPDLLAYLTTRASESHQIPDSRKAELSIVADYISQRLLQQQSAQLIFICTHNSRRSHLSQIWAGVAAEYFGLHGIQTFSGGTEATAFNPRAVEAMRRCGLKIVAEEPSASNPHYIVRCSDSLPPQVCFSKIYNSPPNPTSDFCAIMNCSQADEACPAVRGCELRIPIRYEDPKLADDTAFETQRYDERAAQICTEMLYMMSMVTPANNPQRD